MPSIFSNIKKFRTLFLSVKKEIKDKQLQTLLESEQKLCRFDMTK